jgi:hypothetical protein
MYKTHFQVVVSHNFENAHSFSSDAYVLKKYRQRKSLSSVLGAGTMSASFMSLAIKSAQMTAKTRGDDP